jgi:amino acid transporter
MNTLQTILREWNARYGEFSKLQHLYIAVAIAAIIFAGLISLANYRLGQSILFIAVVAAVIFIANGVVYALLSTFIFDRSKKSSSSQKRSK